MTSTRELCPEDQCREAPHCKYSQTKNAQTIREARQKTKKNIYIYIYIYTPLTVYMYRTATLRDHVLLAMSRHANYIPTHVHAYAHTLVCRLRI